MLWIALAAQLSMPVAVGAPSRDVRAVFSVDDFPAYLQASGESRIVYTRTTVLPDGNIQGCTAETSSGDRKLDAYTCGIILKRARFQPARWIDGSAAYGVVRVPVSWVTSSAPLREDQMMRLTIPDLDLSVDKLPKGAHSIVAVTVEVAADADGHIVNCLEEPPFSPKLSKRRFPELVPIACEQVMKSYIAIPPRDASGKATRSVQNVLVHFQKGK